MKAKRLTVVVFEIVAIATLLTIATVGTAAISRWLSKRNRPPESIAEYTTARVERGDLVQSVDATGQLGPAESVEISSQISGTVTEVAADYGNHVARNQLLARIDPASYEQKRVQAVSELRAAQAAYNLAAAHALRLNNLLSQDLVSAQENEESRANVEQTRSTLLMRRAAVDSAMVDLKRCEIRSPIDGVVIYKQIDVGKTVVSSFSAPVLFTIAKDLSRMRILAHIGQSDVALVATGQAVTFKADALPGQEFHGTVLEVRNPYAPSDRPVATLPQSGAPLTFDAVIDVDNSQSLLKPGFSVDLSIAVNRRHDALLIPNGALRVRLGQLQETDVGKTGGPHVTAGAVSDPITTNGAAVGSVQAPGSNQDIFKVYRLHRTNIPNAALQRVEPVAVHIGLSDGLRTEVVSGLVAGDVIITGMASTVHPATDNQGFF